MNEKEHSSTHHERIGKYVLMDRLGHGGMAEVFRARMYGPGGFIKDCAIKRILPSLLRDEQFVKMFIDEARLTASLSHPNIVQVLELGELKESLFIAMEMVGGKDLLDVLAICARRARRVPRELVLYIMMELLKALDYAHNAADDMGRPMGIVHRDVSPSNVLISYTGNVKIGDFGIARSLLQTNRTEAGTQKGKMGYMSPEQVTGAPIDARSDLFAASVIFFEMLTMTRLFKAENDLDVMLKIRDGQIEDDLQRIRALPADLQYIVRKGLQQKSEDRFQTANEFYTAIARFVYRNELDVGQTTLEAFMREMFADKIAEEQAQRALDPKSDPGLLVSSTAQPEPHRLPPYRYRDEEGRIHGPMTTSMLIELLQSRPVTTPERISLDGGEWLPIQTIPELRDVKRRLEPGTPVVVGIAHDGPTEALATGSGLDELFSDSGVDGAADDPSFDQDPSVSAFLDAARTPPTEDRETPTDSAETLDRNIDKLLKDYLSNAPRDQSQNGFRGGPPVAESGSGSDPNDSSGISTARRNADWEELSTAGVNLRRRRRVNSTTESAIRGRPVYESADDVPVIFGQPDRSGSLEVSTVARLVTTIHSKRLSGLLQVVGTHQHRELFFDKGSPSVVFSSLEEEMLGFMLVRQGIVSVEQVNEVLDRLTEEDPAGLGDEVVRQGWLAPHQLFHVMTEQMREKITNGLFVSEGSWRWWPGAKPAKPTVNLPVDLPSLVNRTLQEHIAGSLVERYFGPRLRMVVELSAPLRDLTQLPLAPKALRVLQQLPSGRPVDQLVEQLSTAQSMSAREIMQLLYLLIQFGALSLKGDRTEQLPGS
jgi:serine/threonine protein kinase